VTRNLSRQRQTVLAELFEDFAVGPMRGFEIGEVKGLAVKLEAVPQHMERPCTSLGTPIRPCALQKEFKATATRAELPACVRLYDLRHSFVTFSLLAGVDIKTVSQEAGHASVAFTLDHYGHVLKEMHETASDKREQLMKSRAASR
jgi:integrase